MTRLSIRPFALAPAGAIALYGGLFLADPVDAPFLGQVSILLVVIALAYGAVFLMGLPLFVVLRRFDLAGPAVGLPAAVLIGVITGALADGVPRALWHALTTRTSVDWSFELSPSAYYAWCGLAAFLSGLVFWYAFQRGERMTRSAV